MSLIPLARICTFNDCNTQTCKHSTVDHHECLETMQLAGRQANTVNSRNRTPRSRGIFAPRALLSFIPGGNKSQQREEKKAELLELIKPLQRGAIATPEDKQAVDAAAKALERLNPNPKSLSSPYVNGKWQLLYTTSQSILGTQRPPFLRPFGPIYQVIDAVNLKARNLETFPFFNQVAAELSPMSSSKVAVQFTQFKILGLFPVNTPESARARARGELEVTYVDEDLRVSRGDKGNLFVLKMVDPNGKP